MPRGRKVRGWVPGVRHIRCVLPWLTDGRSDPGPDIEPEEPGDTVAVDIVTNAFGGCRLPADAGWVTGVWVREQVRVLIGAVEEWRRLREDEFRVRRGRLWVRLPGVQACHVAYRPKPPTGGDG